MATFPNIETTLEKIVGGGQALGTYPDGRKLFVWGGLPGETVNVQIIKKRSRLIEGRVVDVLKPSAERIPALDPDSYLSTSPWQIMTLEAEQHYKAALIEEAFELHDIVLPQPITVLGDGNRFAYRNKVEFSWYWDTDACRLDLAFFVRGGRGKVPVDGTSLAHPNINKLAIAVRDILRTKSVEARSLKTLLIRSNQAGECIWQLYIKDKLELFDEQEVSGLPALGGEIIYSEPKSPASVVTKRLTSYGQLVLNDVINDVRFSYATEGFFQINLPVYEVALKDMSAWIDASSKVVDMYSGVGTIGLTVGGQSSTLIELNEHAVREMKQNIERLGLDANAVQASSESALDYITNDALIILDPPRAGLHQAVVDRLLEVKPSRILYLSCNPVTQARDVALLAEAYGVRWHRGYNFFPCTPHIEHLVVLELKS